MKRIFLVEDDEVIARNLVLLLKSEGYAVVHVHTQSEALSMLAGMKPDLALLDISLPDGNGFAVCTEIQQTQHIPVIFLTASGDEASVVTGLNNDNVDICYLIKLSLQPLLIPMELHNIELQIDVPNGMTLRGDSGWLSEAIQNILKNCMESAGENAKIEIFCKDTVLFTELIIHDSGKGFDAEELPCLFERFYRGKNSNVAGFGIGLALCRTIILGQGGTITAKNHPQGGAVFIIRFTK